MFYQINQNDEIVDLGEGWESFAVASGHSNLERSQVIGKPIFDFINGRGLARLYQKLYQKLRTTAGKEVSFAFRCDSPELKRLMEMKIRHLGNGIINVRSELIKSKARLIPININYDPNSVLILCSLTQQIKLKDQPVFLEIEDFFKINGLPEHELKVIYGVSPEARRMMEANILSSARLGSMYRRDIEAYKKVLEKEFHGYI